MYIVSNVCVSCLSHCCRRRQLRTCNIAVLMWQSHWCETCIVTDATLGGTRKEVFRGGNIDLNDSHEGFARGKLGVIMESMSPQQMSQ